MTTQINTKPNSALLDLTGKSALVTGGALGIGYGIALRLSEAGAAVNLDKAAQDALLANFAKRLPLQRTGLPDDIGTVAPFLCSDMSNYITGQTIVVDGGYLIS